ncbi:MAG: DUF58 domain-containing protein [Planctomycetota bacterium]
MRIVDWVAPRDLSQVAKLQWTAKNIVEGYCSGRHRSPHQGFSVEFKEHRSYVRGDELKSIDWKAFGKSDRLFVRLYEEETNLRCHLIFDRSASMLYAGDRAIREDQRPLSKFEYAKRLAAALTYLLISQQDSVGVMTFDKKIRSVIPCRSRPGHLASIMSVLAQDGKHGETDLGDVLTKAAAKVGRRSLVVLISDGGGEIDSIARALSIIRGRQNEVVFLQIQDPDERDFPFQGRVQFHDLENAVAEQTVDTASIRQAYLQRYQDHQNQLSDLCRRNRIDLLTLTSDQPLGQSLAEYLARRRRTRG